MTGVRFFRITMAVAAITLWAGNALAQTVGDRFLAEASSEGPAACSAVTLRFTVPVRFTGIVSAARTETRLRVEPAVPGNFTARELLAAPAGAASISALAWERDAAGGATLIVTFAAPTMVDVTLGNDSHSIVLNIAERSNNNGCAEAEAPAGAPPDAVDPAELRDLQTRAEDAMLRKDDAAAALLLDRILGAPADQQPPRTIELRGMVYERGGELDLARERYREYLRRFPADAGAVRVRQRIAGLPPASSATAAKEDEASGRWRSTLSASFSQFYSYDKSRNRIVEAVRPEPFEDVDRRINIDQLLSTLDVSASATNGRTRLSARVAGSYTNDFRPVTLVGSSRSAGDDTARLYTFYLDARNETSGLSARIGRQSLFGSGVFGRFDGVRLGWQASPAVELHAQAGFPVYSTRTDRVIRDRRSYGFSIDYVPPDANYALSAYWFDQRSHGLVDRRAVGLEGRYKTKGIALFGLVDVDVAFGKLSHLFLSATIPMKGGASLSIQADQQYYPPLTLTNAVIGQPVPRLEELKRQFDRLTLEQFAEGRSARSRNLTVTYTKPLSERWTAQIDLTLANTGPTPGSAGVEAVPGSGTEVYASGQLVGNGILRAGDTLIGGLRYASADRFHIVDGELTARIPFGPRLGIEPRLRVARRTDKFGSGHQTVWRSNLRATWQATRSIAFDAEVGLIYFRQRQDDPVFVSRNREHSTLVSFGYRLSF